MSTLGKWATPHGVAWSANDGHGSGYVTTNRLHVSSNAVAYFGFYSEYRTFQIQWRLRKRLGPLNTAINDHTIEQEQWTAWSAWQGMVNDVANIDMGGSLNQLCAYQTPMSFAYDFSLYDKMEYEVRVRAFDEPSLTHSEWCYETLPVCYVPTFKVTAAKVDQNGDLVVSYSTNWQRGGNRVKRGTVYCNGVPLGVADWTETPNMPAPNGSFVVNKAQFGTLSNGQRILIGGCTFYTVDNVFAGYVENTVAVVGTEAPSGDASAPDVAYSVDARTLSLSVTATKKPGTSDYTAMRIVMTYADMMGVVRVVEPYSVVSVLGTWTALFDAPPLDTPLTIMAAGINAFGTASSETQATVDNDGRIMWTHGTDVVALDMVASWSSKYVPAVETGRPVGRSRSVAFIGDGGTTELKASGDMWVSRPDSAYQSAGAARRYMERLKDGRAWTFRASHGDRFSVAITDVEVSHSAPDMVYRASVSMVEVS